MAQLQQVKIFLASPGDVPTERRYVKEVVDELNTHLAPAHKVVLTLVNSERVRPGIGKDGQSIVNEQIGRMSNYDIFIGIMWKRFGTPTPRARSGTVEEYNRARASFKRNGVPLIWFFFRQPETQFRTKEDERQQKDVLRFKSRVRRVGVYKEYPTPADFKKQLRQHLTSWLVDPKRPRKTPATRTTPRKVAAKPKPAVPRRVSQGSGSVSSPQRWVMLGDMFFQTASSKIRPDHTILLQISTADRERIAELRSLIPRSLQAKRQISYADNLEAAIVGISNVHVESTGRTTVFDIELVPSPKTHGHYVYGYNDRELASMQVRMLLLGEPLPKEVAFFSSTIYVPLGHNKQEVVKGPILPALWSMLKTSPRSFLPKAWLVTAYYLKMSNLVDEILELRLGPIKDRMMTVRFRGTRSSNSNHPEVIEVVGKCPLAQ